MLVIPENFVRHMHQLHGAEGQLWLDRLPAILAACEQRWDLKIGAPFTNLSFHYVTSAVSSGGEPVVVKACSPTGEFEVESEAIRLFDGHGMARLLASDKGDEVMVLERLQPGTLLKSVEDDEKAISAAASVMKQLWRPAPSGTLFPTVQDWGKGFARLRQHYDGGHGPFPPALLEEAEHLYAELLASMDEPALLHGDLHQENILAAQCHPWLAIDPKGLIGEPAYEIGALLRNPLPELLKMPHPGRVLARRVDQLAEELGLDRERIRGWGLSQAVLSVWWGIEDENEFYEDTLICAELLAQI
jgi:streptomycin 6-kinase